MSSPSPETYEKLWVSDFFHDFPHINFDFVEVNSTFNPESNSYRQALVFWGIIPVALCFFLWLIFLIYFIFRCCQEQDRSKQRRSACPRVVTGLLILMGIGFVAFGFYENENAHRGVEGVRGSMIDANNTLTTAAQRVETLDSLADDVSTRISDALEQATSEISNLTIREKALKLINRIREMAKTARINLDQVNLNEDHDDFDEAINTSDEIEYYRWMATIVILCLYIVIFVLSFVGLLVKSKGTLIVCAAIAIISSLFMWTSTGAYISLSVGLGDLCDNPDSYFIGLAEGTSSEAAVRAYIKCTDPSQPYQQAIVNATSSVTQAMITLNDTVKLAKPYHIPDIDKFVDEMRGDLQFAIGNLSTLLDNVGICTTLHHYYITGLNSACSDTIEAAALLSLVCCVVGILCTIIIFTMSCLWRQYIKKRVRSSYVPADDTDPFLPRPPPYESDYGTMRHSSPRPWSERGTLQQNSITQDSTCDSTLTQDPLQPASDHEQNHEYETMKDPQADYETMKDPQAQ